jgi:cysteine desulfuration protein SufE
LIVKGLVALLLKVYSGSTPNEVLMTPPEFLRALGFEWNLSPSRANGLHSMLKQIKLYATAFDYMLKLKK